MENIGERLRKARKGKGLSIEEVQRATHIHHHVLETLESNKMDAEMSPVYAKSFLKRYGDFLGLDTEKLLKDYEKKGPKQNEPIIVINKEERIDWALKLKQFRVPIAAAVVVLFLVLVISGSVVGVKKIATIARERRAKAIALKVDKESNEKIIISKKKAEPAKTEAPVTKTRMAKAATVMAPKISIPKNEPLTLIVKTFDDVWLQVKSDDKIIFRNVLPKGSVEAWKANDEITLWTGKADKMELVLNGTSLGSPGKGVVKDIVITRKGMKIKE